VGLREGGLIAREHRGAAIEAVCFGHFIVLIGKVELGIQLFLQIIFKKWFSKIDSVAEAKFIELIELNECHSKSIKSAFKRIFFPILKLNLQSMLKE